MSAPRMLRRAHLHLVTGEQSREGEALRSDVAGGPRWTRGWDVSGRDPRTTSGGEVAVPSVDAATGRRRAAPIGDWPDTALGGTPPECSDLHLTEDLATEQVPPAGDAVGGVPEV